MAFRKLLLTSGLWLTLAVPAMAGPVAYFGPMDNVYLTPTPMTKARFGMRAAYASNNSLALPALGLHYGLRPNLEVGFTSGVNLNNLGTTAFGGGVSNVSPFVKWLVGSAGPVNLGLLAGTTVPLQAAGMGTFGLLGLAELPNPIVNVGLNLGAGTSYDLVTTTYTANLGLVKPLNQTWHLIGEALLNGGTGATPMQVAGRLGVLAQWHPELFSDLSVRVQQDLSLGGTLATVMGGTTATF